MIAVALRIAVIIFLAEAVIMLGLFPSETLSATLSRALIDGILLVLLSTLPIYFLVIRPFIRVGDQSEERVRLLLDSTAEGIYGLDLKGNCTICNPSCVRMLGYDRADELVGRNMHDLIHHTRPDGTSCPTEQCPIVKAFRQGEGVHIDTEVLWRRDGGSFPAEYWSYPVFRDGKVIGSVVTFLDITERKEAERERLRTQKMDSLGSLAGGVAHDINNMLLPVLTLTAMVAEAHPEGSPERKKLEVVLQAAGRMKEMAARVLAFSREDEDGPSQIDIFQVCSEGVEFLRSTLPSTIILRADLDPDAGKVLAAAKQIEAILMNLASNASDAMQGNTRELNIALSPAAVDEDAGKKIGLKAGRYARLTVSDTGCGMDEATMERIYEPLFTTKEKGLGTGLGMSMIFGTVTKCGGAIKVASEVGKGTTVEIHLPLVE